MPSFRIGMSGWVYPPWRKSFYPSGLSQKRELEFASRQVSSIEVNGSFYSLQRPESYHRWFQETPDRFVFSIKANRFITHVRRLLNVESALANFFASGLLGLGKKLGPILWQFPPNFSYEPDRMERFFDTLPQNFAEAAELAEQHEPWMEERSFFEFEKNLRLRHAVEIRNSSFVNPRFIDQLKQHGIALVVADTAGKWPHIEEVTTDFVYARLHGDRELYASGYTPQALNAWAKKLRAWKRDAFVYFDNDVKVHAPFDAMGLQSRLSEFQPAVVLKFPKAA